jgi:hypothetical protein
MNSKFVSSPSVLQSKITEHHGSLLDQPQRVVLGQYSSATSLSLSYDVPQHDDSLSVTTHVIESDTSSSFDPVDDYMYMSASMSVVPEVQQILVSFRAGDSVKSRGGAFALTFGRRTTAPLDFDISANDLEIALNILISTRHVAVALVVVTNAVFNHGFKWQVMYQGVSGDIGLLLVDSSRLY